MMTKLWRYDLRWLMAVVVLAALVALALPAAATEDPLADGETTALNPAQQAKVDQLAAAALDPADYENLAQALAELEAAEQALAEDPENTELQDAVIAAQAAVDQAMGEAVGVLSAEITAMREAGLGWGEIAQELGVHPSVLGLGHKYAKGQTKRMGEAEEGEEIQARDRDRITTRNMAGGVAKGHGVSPQGKLYNSQGLGAEKSNADQGDSSDSSGSGNSNKGGNSNSNKGGNKGGNSGGNNGGGNGGGHGGGRNK